MAFQEFHQAVNAELRVTPHEQVYMIRHDFHLDQLLSPPLDLLGKDRFQSLIYRWRQHFTSVLGTEDHMIPTDIGDIVVAAHIFHAKSILR